MSDDMSIPATNLDTSEKRVQEARVSVLEEEKS